MRRRALLAFSSLSRRNPELLTRILGNVMKCLENPHQSVVSAALVVSSLFSEVRFLILITQLIFHADSGRNVTGREIQRQWSSEEFIG